MAQFTFEKRTTRFGYTSPETNGDRGRKRTRWDRWKVSLDVTPLLSFLRGGLVEEGFTSGKSSTKVLIIQLFWWQCPYYFSGIPFVVLSFWHWYVSPSVSRYGRNTRGRVWWVSVSVEEGLTEGVQTWIETTTTSVWLLKYLTGIQELVRVDKV